MKLYMINWDYIRQNHPKALTEYMSKDWTLKEFWNAYETYVNLSIIEDEIGFEWYDLKIESKLIMYSSLCFKSIISNGKKIKVIRFEDYQEKKINQIFKLVDDQLKNRNYLKN